MPNIVALYHAPDVLSTLTRPLAQVASRFSSPADDHLDGDLEVQALLIQHLAATYDLRLAADSMQGVALYDALARVAGGQIATPVTSHQALRS
jgi:hypothetical protein